MKLENVKIGMRVFVKKSKGKLSYAHESFQGKIAEVVYIESDSYTGNLTVKIEESCGTHDWCNHNDLRKLRDGEV